MATLTPWERHKLLTLTWLLCLQTNILPACSRTLLFAVGMNTKNCFRACRVQRESCPSIVLKSISKQFFSLLQEERSIVKLLVHPNGVGEGDKTNEMIEKWTGPKVSRASFCDLEFPLKTFFFHFIGWRVRDDNCEVHPTVDKNDWA